ncbi:MAG TPA: alkaline phosphatase family protein [Candidatus Binatia bacterium]|nr:alkaline phosphatase family protein [Candidatus Binatia bacterium]
MRLFRALVDRFYNEKVEDLCTRVLYFNNTLDTYFLIGALLSLLLVGSAGPNLLWFLPVLVATWVCFKISDFYPVFLLFTPLFAVLLANVDGFDPSVCAALFGANLLAFVVIQFLFMGIPDSIVARDPTISVRKLWNSVFTIAPTTVSLLMSVYFSTLCSLLLYFKPNPFAGGSALLLWLGLFAAAFVTKRSKPRSFASETFLPRPPDRVVDRVVVLNIDGCRLDRFHEARLPLFETLKETSSYLANGATTVYRALTNPAFVSILTGTTPEVHGVRDNNLGRRIRVEGLPDVVDTILYGSMHVKHFSKPRWKTKVVSLPVHSVYRSDDIMLEWLKEDLLNGNGTRLFVADLSEVDFLGHAYGSESRQYLDAIGRAGERIERFLAWLEREDALRTAVIVSSDHGMVAIDHSYLLFDAEKFVPLFFLGHGIRKGIRLDYATSIMDITPTISYLLGARYPESCGGKVIIEAIEAQHGSAAVSA